MLLLLRVIIRVILGLRLLLNLSLWLLDWLLLIFTDMKKHHTIIIQLRQLSLKIRQFLLWYKFWLALLLNSLGILVNLLFYLLSLLDMWLNPLVRLLVVVWLIEKRFNELFDLFGFSLTLLKWLRLFSAVELVYFSTFTSYEVSSMFQLEFHFPTTWWAFRSLLSPPSFLLF